MDLIVLKDAKVEYVEEDGHRGRITLTSIDGVPFALELKTFGGAAELIIAALSMATAAGAARDALPPGKARPPAGAIPLQVGRVDVRPSPGAQTVALAFRFGVIDLEFHLLIHELRRIGEGLVQAAIQASLEPKQVQ